MPIRVVVVDDEKPARNRVVRLLSAHPDFVLAGEAADVDSAVELIERENPDLCFLDVKMPGGDGFDVIRRLKRVPHVIFTTAFDEFAVRAFEVRSLDYLLKPIDRGRFGAALERAREMVAGAELRREDIVKMLQEIRDGLRAEGRAPALVRGAAAAASPEAGGGGVADGESPDAEAAGSEGSGDEDESAEGDSPDTGGLPLRRIAGKRGAKIVILDVAEVLWFEAEVTIVFARARGGRYLVGKTLTELESQLDPAQFFRTHRRYIVNLSLVREIQPADEGTYRVVMKDDPPSVVPLSRRQARRLRARIPW